MSEAEDVLDFLAVHPTAATILAARYQVKTSSLRGKRWKDLNPDHLESEMSAVSMMMGQGAEKLDNGMRESIQYAAELQEKMFKKKPN